MAATKNEGMAEEPNMLFELDFIRSIFLALWHRKWVFTAFSTLLSAICAYGILHITPLYRATALVDVSTEPVGVLERDPIRIQTEVDILASDQIARLVIQQLHLDKDAVFIDQSNGAHPSLDALVQRCDQIARLVIQQLHLCHDAVFIDQSNGAHPSLDALVQRYRSLVMVQNSARSTLATVSVSSTDPSLAAAIANTQAKAYLRQRLERKLENTDVSERKLVSPAEPPAKPYYPRKALMVLISIFLSATASALAVIALDGSVALAYSMVPLGEANGLRVIASVPLPGRSKGSSTSTEIVFRDRMRMVRDAVLGSVQGESIVIVVASSLPDEGKSLICLALAEALSGPSARTLVVDADLRKPSLANLAKARIGYAVQSGSGQGGIEAVLNGAPIEQEVIGCAPNLDLLPAFRGPKAPIDPLTGDAITRLLAQARKFYKFIVVDTPPLAVLYDGGALASMADQTLFISQGGGASARLMGDSLRTLRAAHASVLGLVHTGRLLSDLEVGRRKSVQAYYQE